MRQIIPPVSSAINRVPRFRSRPNAAPMRRFAAISSSWIARASASRIPVALSVFIPGNPVIPNDLCQTYLRIELTGGAAVLKYDPNTAPEGFSTDLVAADLSGVTPNTSQC
ncbi:MAG: hypothetical protein ACREXY_00365, partial [Gammaproteobacteria bacterium]